MVFFHFLQDIHPVEKEFSPLQSITPFPGNCVAI